MSARVPEHACDYIADIAARGGWRVFMRNTAGNLSGKLMAELDAARPDDPIFKLTRAFVLAKHGRTREARKELDMVRDSIACESREIGDVLPEFALVDAHVRVYEDRPSSHKDAQDLHSALERMGGDDQIGQGLALNQLCIYYLHKGHFDKAQEYAENAIRHYRQGGANFGSLHLLAHLGQIKLMRGDLDGAEQQFLEMEDQLSSHPDSTDALLAICHALRSEVAYEMNALSDSSAFLESAIGSIEEDDAWLDVRAAAYRVRIRLAYVRSGLPGALTELAHCERVAVKRGMPRLGRLMQVERLRVLTLSDELGAASMLMQKMGLAPDEQIWNDDQSWAFSQGTTAVALARWLTRARRAGEALTLVEPAEDFAIRGGQLLALAKLRVIKSAAHWRLNQKTDATRSLLSAIRLLGNQPFRRFILDEGREIRPVVEAALDGDHVSIPPSPQQRRRLAELSHYWMTANQVLEKNHSGFQTPPTIADDVRWKYLQLLAQGSSNKEIARIMGVSVNTVKYHLKLLFRDLRVDNRTRAVTEGQRLGIIDSQHLKQHIH